ncbi:glycosyltransferase [Caloramator sp. mosi_1]|uniref:glycosyltransferase n=1 Tax=Caloramator sp. mosi_1 TaxID=3023090 RepID=UPI002360B846|nr:glycosyltransferase [Caloramator sp. mosi_1]WDC85738.1 glycosyltransferase [Caloramator sp. mosi_1]
MDFVEDVRSILTEIDVFGYPLMPYHTCSTENAILEAMAVGIPPVLLNQLTEKYIVEDGITGFIVNNKEEYGKIIRYLYKNEDVRKKLVKMRENMFLTNIQAKTF